MIMPPVIDQKNCTQCGQCIDICSEDVFFGSEKKKTPIVSYPQECWHCNACVAACPAEGAIHLRIPLPMMVCYK
jgi:adenylylsulfate reductase subunit B